MSLYLGIDIGGTKCALLLGDENGRVLHREEWPSHAARGPAAMLADFTSRAQNLSGFIAAGVSIGGPLDTVRGIVFSPPHLPGWDCFPLKEFLQNALGVPVFVEHDAAACALAEYTWGGWGAGARNLIYLTCGTGFGAGIVLDGRIHRGAGGHSLEAGHARFAPDGPRAFGKTGSLEAWCSGTALRLLSEWKHGRSLDARILAALASQGDERAREIISLNARAVGQVCANFADLLFPDMIVLGSLARHLGDDWLHQVRAQFAAETHPAALERCRLAPAALGDRLQDLSALVTAHQAHGSHIGSA